MMGEDRLVVKILGLKVSSRDPARKRMLLRLLRLIRREREKGRIYGHFC